MKATSAISKFTSWLASPEVFGSITKKIPGNWLLFEYYYDLNEDLIHWKEEDIKKNSELLQIVFTADEQFSVNEKLPLSVFKNLPEGKWSVSRNYITLIDPKNFRNNLEFQFAFEKENLKLLKKDKMGKIEFFGFFKNVDSKRLIG
ncbi:MAG TPA: hypothetical protein PK335_03055 [Draconibacterium sp.]|nr:hypothetical protein [Draconibacterium sp.]